jgi:hypothetical protein
LVNCKIFLDKLIAKILFDTLFVYILLKYYNMMKKGKLSTVIIIILVFIVLTSVLVFASSSAQTTYKNQLQLKKCIDKSIFDNKKCLKEALNSYYNCTSGVNLNYYKNGMDFWKFLGICQKNVLRPLQKACKTDYNNAIFICKSPIPITNPAN